MDLIILLLSDFVLFSTGSAISFGFLSTNEEKLIGIYGKHLTMNCDYFHLSGENFTVIWMKESTELSMDKEKMKSTTYEIKCPNEKNLQMTKTNISCFTNILQLNYFCTQDYGLYQCLLNAPLNKSISFNSMLLSKIPETYLMREIFFKKEMNDTCVGTNVKLYCSVTPEADDSRLVIAKGDRPINLPVLWKYNPCLKVMEHYFNSSELTYEIKNAQVADSGVYRCFDQRNEKGASAVHFNIENCARGPYRIGFILLLVFCALFIALPILVVTSISYIKKRSRSRPLPLEDLASISDRHNYTLCIDFTETTNFELSEHTNLETLKLIKTLGSGEFGTVYLAEVLNDEDGRPQPINVAVKKFKNGATSGVILENDIMSKIGRHKNVISYFGSVSVKGQLAIIMEYASLGSLIDLLRKRLHLELNHKTLCQFGIDVASGMEYLASIKLVHRDLAARNVLVTENRTLKVADFGLTREVIEYYRQSSGTKIPVRWLAPECIQYRMYSTASDVWAFGIVLWEIFSLGSVPYQDVTDVNSLFHLIPHGLKNSMPRYCNSTLFSIMEKTWVYEVQGRPSFNQLLVDLNGIIKNCSSDPLV